VDSAVALGTAVAWGGMITAALGARSAIIR
jgi:hypothetical protein